MRTCVCWRFCVCARACIHAADEAAQRLLLERCAMTSLNSKLIRGHKEFFSKMVVDAVQSLTGKAGNQGAGGGAGSGDDGGDQMNLRHVGIKKVAGGSVTESRLVRGVAFKKTFS